MINETAIYEELLHSNKKMKRQFDFVLLSKTFRVYIINIMEGKYLSISKCKTSEDKIAAYNLFSFAKECNYMSFYNDGKDTLSECYEHACILVNTFNVAKQERLIYTNPEKYKYSDGMYNALFDFVYHYNIFNKSILDELTDLEISRMRNKE